MTFQDYMPRLFISFAVVCLVLLLKLFKNQSRKSQGDKADRGYRQSRKPCAKVSSKIYRRPDPLIYCQKLLMSQGFAVTWDNPDIQLVLKGVQVPSSSISPDTEYEIVARIWNGSTSAPAVNMPVRFSYLNFGMGTISVPIGEVRVDLPVKGAVGHPAFARIQWRTPSVPGHYCIQVNLIWDDDANPANNLGQENVDVKPLNSPRAAFQFPIRNDAQWLQSIHLEVDTYQIPDSSSCDQREVAETPALSSKEREKLRREADALHGRGKFPIPEGWRVVVEPQEFSLSPGEEQVTIVDITAPEGFSGQQIFNVNGFDNERLIGGVTLQVHS
jgi:hypothetical protein